ncbi:efflux RND transporter permease subunit [Parasalinivibrio latis]|uniref:efflux RND transporter permease subunit n=1 Tax=Parasalinivibrio latis TaxID=2952610 RepID=UPI0030E26448
MANVIGNIRLLILATALILVAGLSAIQTLPRAEDPKLTNRWANVTTIYPGASAERVEALVTEKVETALRQLADITQIDSISRPGLSVVTVELHDDLKETEPSWSKIRDELSEVAPSLPTGAAPPTLNTDLSDAFTYILALQWKSPDAQQDLLALGRYAKDIARQFRNLSGTDYVKEYGLPIEELLVEIDPYKASSAGITAGSLSQAIAGADAKGAAGEIINSDIRMQVELRGEIDSLHRLRDVPVRVNADGHQIRLSDIASVQLTELSPYKEHALHNGQAAILVAVRMQSGQNIERWTRSVEEVIASAHSVLPTDISLTTLFKQSTYTETRLVELLDSLLIGFVLIVGVLLVTLGARSAILVALSLPVTGAVTLFMMKATGLPVNQMSVTGLIVSLGIMVDNAIVMVDTIQRQREKGAGQFEAAEFAIKHLWTPLLGSTLTTVLAFAPIFLMPGAAGEFVGAIAITVTFSLIGSYLISHSLVAGFGAHFLRSGNTAKHWYTQGAELPALGKLFNASLKAGLKWPVVTLVMVFCIPAVGFWSASQLTEQFFPPSDRDMFELRVYMSPMSSIDQTSQAAKEIDQILQSKPGVENVTWVVGNNVPAFYYNLQSKNSGTPSFAQAMIKVSDFRVANRLIPELQIELDEKISNAQIIVKKLEQGPPFNAPLEVRVIGPSLDRIKVLGEQIRLIMAETQYVTHTRETLQPGLPKVMLDVNEQASQINGHPLSTLAKLLQSTLSGAVNGSMIESTEEIPVRVRIGDSARTSLEGLSNLRIPTQTGSMPLSALASATLEPARGAIPHRNGERVNTVEGYIVAGVLPQTALDLFHDNLEAASISLPPGYRLEFGGESAERNESVGKLKSNLALVITLLVAVVIISFNSFRLSTIVFLVAFQAAGLGLLSVWAFSYPFGFTVIIGLLGLIGLAVNAAIVILAELKENPDACNGDKAAIIDSVASCSRHIISTTITTVGGFLPLILSGGGFWPPFAIAIAGGTVLTTILSFYFVPSAFWCFVRFRPLPAKHTAIQPS